MTVAFKRVTHFTYVRRSVDERQKLAANGPIVRAYLEQAERVPVYARIRHRQHKLVGYRYQVAAAQ